MSDEQIDLFDILRSGEDSRQRRHRRDRALPPPVMLFCGADQGLDLDEHRPWAVEVLPQTETPPPRKRQRRSNGCGARIHSGAVAEKRWLGLVDGVREDVAIALQEEYFTPDMKKELVLGRERCGCSRTGIGCAICGNPLGALFKPCQRHAEPYTTFSGPHYVFHRAAVSPPLPPLTRRASLPVDELRSEREALQRRIRERQDLLHLRARVRATAAPQVTQPVGADDSDPRETPRPSPRFFMRRERDRAHDGPPLTRAPALDSTAFEAWAEETIQRATAVAASDMPVIDVSALLGLPGEQPRVTTTTTTTATDAAADRPPARPETPEWWRELRSGVTAAATTRRRPFGRDRERDRDDWAGFFDGTGIATPIQSPPLPDFLGSASATPAPQALASANAERETNPEEQEKEEAAPRPFFER